MNHEGTGKVAKRPFVQVNLEVEDAIFETVHLIRSFRSIVDIIGATINERFNSTFVSNNLEVGDDISKILSNIEAVTRNIATSTSSINQPFLFIVFIIFSILLVILIAVLLFITLKTRKEFLDQRRRKTSSKVLKAGKVKLRMKDRIKNFVVKRNPNIGRINEATAEQLHEIDDEDATAKHFEKIHHVV